MLDVGLIGLGPKWEHRYRPALEKLRHRLRVRAIQSAVEIVAETAAGDWHCDATCGILSLLERPDVKAVLILDTAWYGAVPAELACRFGKPVFLAGNLSEWVARASQLIPLAAESNTTLMPDFGHRYTPATSRLKELIATRLGRPETIRLHIPPEPQVVASLEGALVPESMHESLTTAIDWVCHLVGTAPAEIRQTPLASGEEKITIDFHRSVAGGTPTSATIVVGPGTPLAAAAAWSTEIRCRTGTARLSGTSRIEWKGADQERDEVLADDRTAVEVMLDHFSRRVVGGLIPVPTLDDLARAASLADLAAKSRETGRPAPIA